MNLPSCLRCVAISGLLAALGTACAAPTDDEELAEHRLAVKSQGLDNELASTLAAVGFTGTMESQLEQRLGRPIDAKMVDLGRLLFHDKILALHDDNPCAGCHDAARGFGDSQPMAIGVDNNNRVGPNRRGPRNQRRSPGVANTIFYKALMWTPRFIALSGDPFNSPQGFKFPGPENVITGEPTLLAAQGSLPSTELVEMAGFTGTCKFGVLDPRLCVFDDGHGQELPAPLDGFFNFPIQDAVDARLNESAAYRKKFGEVFNNGRPFNKGGITISMRRRAIAEFQTYVTAADAPLDRFARGDRGALTVAQKRGAQLFFGKANCVVCHQVAGQSNEMFSDFKPHRIGGPQVAPGFGPGRGNTIFDGEGQNEDFGFMQTEGDPALKYMFRTAPLRNLKAARAFFHNGAFGSVSAAIKHHLDPVASLETYDPKEQNVPADLVEGPFEGILALGLDPLLGKVRLSDRELDELADFVENGLTDPKVFSFCRLVPSEVPSGMPLPVFEGCP
jgi:cytochrome c peroxidase